MLNACIEGWTSVLGPLVSETTTQADLRAWVQSSAIARSVTLKPCSDTLAECKALFVKQELLPTAEKISKMSAWFVSCAGLFEDGADVAASLSMAKQLTKDFKTCFSVFPAGLHEGALKSPLLVENGEFDGKVVDILKAAGAPIGDAVAAALVAVMGSFSLADPSIQAASLEVLKALDASVIDQKAFKDAVQWATETDDGELLAQCNLLHNAVLLLKNMAAAEVMAREVVSQPGKRGKISEAQVACLKALRARYSGYLQVVQETPDVFSPRQLRSTRHMTGLDDKLDAEKFGTAVSANMQHIIEQYRVR